MSQAYEVRADLKIQSALNVAWNRPPAGPRAIGEIDRPGHMWLGQKSTQLLSLDREFRTAIA